MKRRAEVLGLVLILVVAGCDGPAPPTGPEPRPQTDRTPASAVIGINVLLERPADDRILSVLGRYGTVAGRIDEIDAVFVRGRESALPELRALPFVAEAGPDVGRHAPPLDGVPAAHFADGLSTWNLDAVNVTEHGFGNRAVPYDGEGVYVGVLDTGLLDSWRQYFPQERIAEEYARSFTGSGAAGVQEPAEQPNKWEHDTHSHGTHVTSSVIGYSLSGTPVNGVAPQATVIPVKVLNNDGAGWSSVIARGIVYVAELKAAGGPLEGYPVVINMSLGGPVLDPVEKAAIDYAIDQGVIVVAAAGNQGDDGMSYPGAYQPVISAAAAGWSGQWLSGADGEPANWWFADDVAESTDGGDFYIVSFSSREKPGQDLDVSAPGVWVVGPWQTQMGQASYFFVSGTSMAAPHVSGVVALLAQQDRELTAEDAELLLEDTAVPIAESPQTVLLPGGGTATYNWDSDATGAGLVQADAALGAGS